MRERIYIGNQTAFSADDFRAPFEYALAHGFDAFEWFPDRKPWGGGWDERDLTADARRAVRIAASQAGMRLSVHARWEANPIHQGAWPILELDVALAQEIGASILNVHLEMERGLEAYVAGVVPLLHRIAGSALHLAIENTPMTEPDAFNHLFARLRDEPAASQGRVGMCFDLGHANLCASTRNDFLKFMDRLEPAVPIIHVHAHENWGDSDSHLPLFTGPARQDDVGVREFLKRLRARRYSGAIILEQWPRPPGLLTEARDRLRAMLESDPP